MFQKPNYSKEEIEVFQTKDKRISWLSIFSSLCNHNQGGGDLKAMVESAFSINNELYAKYPFPEAKSNNPPPTAYKPATAPLNASGSGSDTKLCPVCGAFMIRQTNKRNPAGPDWKCSVKTCKWQWQNGEYVKSNYITSAWDVKEKDVARANFEDDAADQAHHQNEHFDNSLPPEYGGN
jgi:hypothetical protein